MRRQKLYDVKAVWEYIKQFEYMDVIEGSLIDTYILYHDNGVIEVWEETYLNEWSSAYIRHIYKAGLPEKFINALEEV